MRVGGTNNSLGIYTQVKDRDNSCARTTTAQKRQHEEITITQSNPTTSAGWHKLTLTDIWLLGSTFMHFVHLNELTPIEPPLVLPLALVSLGPAPL